ncbi:MAG: DUF499 domain-containing protein [Nitrososphaeria archaeon]
MGVIDLYKKGFLEVWPDLFDLRFDDKAAPQLGDILKGEEERVYSDSSEFFSRTYLTTSMRRLIEDVAEALKNDKGGTIFLLTSLFGGGKTHTLISLYHAFTNAESLKAVDERLAAKVAEAGKPIVVVLDGSRADLIPHPKQPLHVEGFSINTLWGILAYRLGAYAKVRDNDSKDSPAPETTLIKQVLSEPKAPILILLDEIVHYVFNMEKSPEVKDYAEKLPLFLHWLASAIEGSPKTVLVASVQVELKGEERREEEMFKGCAGRIFTALRRETSRIVVPVSPDDVVKVLQRRIFKNVPADIASEARDRIYKVYREYSSIFGTESDWQFSPEESAKALHAKDTYPFHPKYVQVLSEFVSRNRDLQKTRDAIRITRKVVRRFLRGTEDAEFIMPWHIDLGDSSIRGHVLTESRREFRDVASRDIVSEDGRLGSVAECSNSNLALKIATSIFLKVYTYDSFKEPLKVFPTLKDIALMVYEPETFNARKLNPTDIENVLDEMYGKLRHLNLEDGRYWFDPYRSVIEYVEKRSEEIFAGPKLELYRIAAERAKQILARREKGEGRPDLFEEKNVMIVCFGDEAFGRILPPDKPVHQLIVYLKPDVTEEDVEAALFSNEGGGRRTYANTVAAVLPRKDFDFSQILKYAAKIKAAEEVGAELSEYYTDEEIRNIQSRKLKNYRDRIEGELKSSILLALTVVKYPRYEDGRNVVKSVDVTSANSIILQVESGLKDSRSGPKLRTRVSFSELNDFLKRNLNWNIVDGTERKEFREIMNFFYTNPVAPFTSRKTIEDAIREGVESCSIGLNVRGRLYWKKVGPEDGAELPPAELVDDVEILPYKVAANMLKNSLLGTSGKKIEAGKVHTIWYEVTFSGKTFKLEDLVNQQGWEKILKEAVIEKREEWAEKRFTLELKPSYIRVGQGNAVEAKVLIGKVGEYDNRIHLIPEAGSIVPDSGHPPFESTWNIGVIEKPGEHDFRLEAKGDDGTVELAVLKVEVESLEKIEEVKTLTLEHVQAKLVGLTVSDISSAQLAVSIMSKFDEDAKVNFNLKFGERISFNISDENVKVAEVFVRKVNEIARSLPTFKVESICSVSASKPILLDSSKISSFNILSEKATFKLLIKRG